MWEVGQYYVCSGSIKKIVALEPGRCYRRITIFPYSETDRKTIPHDQMVENGCYLLTPELAAIWRLNNYIPADIYKEIVDGYKH